MDIEAIVFDTTSSNTGENKGLAGRLRRARNTQWEVQGGEGSCPVLIVKGCEDHILNLMSKDMETYLVGHSLPALVINKKHRATDLVQLLIHKLRKNTGAFRFFMQQKYPGLKLHIPRISDTRFCRFLFSFLSILWI